MTWWRDEGRYEVFFNRDELKTRSRALPPEARVTGSGVRYLSPTDPDAGGTWMLVNEYGLTVCLLNRWHQDGGKMKTPQSRGQLVLALAGIQSEKDVMQRMQDVDLRVYRPFTLVAMDRDGMSTLVWDGQDVSVDEAEAPLTSSSYRFPEVKQARCKVYEALQDRESDALMAYQAAAGTEELSAYTVRMNRPDAQTWSRSRVVVDEGHIHWSYLEEMPDMLGDSIEHESELVLG